MNNYYLDTQDELREINNMYKQLAKVKEIIANGAYKNEIKSTKNKELKPKLKKVYESTAEQREYQNKYHREYYKNVLKKKRQGLR